MTGYGKSETVFASKKIIAEVKSLNGKQADISTRLASQYKEKDLELRALVAQKLARGKADLSVSIENRPEEGAAVINTSLFAAYKRQITEIAEATGTELPQDMFATILRMPDVMKTEQNGLSEDEWTAVKACVEDALDKLEEFRMHEGAGLEKFFTERLDIIENLLHDEVPKYEKSRIDKIKARMRENLAEIQSKAYDENRFEQELIYYIEKLDISEEKQRLQKHLDYFRSAMKESESQGKKLGFVAQEMGREINTLGSKANHAELQIVVVKMKDELEKIKEQVLNVL